MSVATGERPKFRVLIVDDEAPVREFIDRILGKRYITSVAANGDEAIRIAEAHGPFDLLLADLTMPGMRGDEVARRLRLTEPDLKVLYLTGDADRLFEERQVLWENEAFLEKPTTPLGLLEAVSLLLVGSIPGPRPPRVRIPGARVHLAGDVGTIEAVSVTGALVTAAVDLPVGSSCPLRLDFPTATLNVTGRVASSSDAASAAPQASRGSAGPRRIAFAFVNLPAEARRMLQQVCENAERA